MTYERGTKFEDYFEEKIKSDPELAWEYVKAMEGEIELLSKALQDVAEIEISDEEADVYLTCRAMKAIALDALKEWESK